jgi:hypothetical protein
MAMCRRIFVSYLNEIKEGVVRMSRQRFFRDRRADALAFLFVENPRSLHACNAPTPAATTAMPGGPYLRDTVKAKFDLELENEDQVTVAHMNYILLDDQGCDKNKLLSDDITVNAPKGCAS